MAWPNVYGLDSSRFDNGGARRPPMPTIVLVHDAFHTSSHLEQLVRELRDADFRTLSPQLPSSSSTHQANVFEADVQTICDYTRPETEAGRNVVFILHGYGGLPGSVAAERLNQHALTRPRTGYVVKIIFVAALIAKEAECYLDILRPEWLTHEVQT